MYSNSQTFQFDSNVIHENVLAHNVASFCEVFFALPFPSFYLSSYRGKGRKKKLVYGVCIKNNLHNVCSTRALVSTVQHNNFCMIYIQFAFKQPHHKTIFSAFYVRTFLRGTEWLRKEQQNIHAYQSSNCYFKFRDNVKYAQLRYHA